jgi:hypothetical protein
MLDQADFQTIHRHHISLQTITLISTTAHNIITGKTQTTAAGKTIINTIIKARA